MRPTHTLLLCVLALPLAACATSTGTTAGRPVAAEIGPTIVEGIYIPAGTTLVAQLEQPIGTAISTEGQRYSASIISPVVDDSGEPIVPTGSRLEGRVISLRQGAAGEPAAVELSVESVLVGGVEHPVQARIVRADVDASRRGVKAEHVLGGAAGGALLGAIVGGSAEGALIGGGVGAGLGTLISLGTAGTDAHLPVGTALAIELRAPLAVDALRRGVR